VYTIDIFHGLDIVKRYAIWAETHYRAWKSSVIVMLDKLRIEKLPYF